MKLTQQDATNILNEFQNELENLRWYKAIEPEIKASLLYGSVAKGTNRPDSDIDLLLIVPIAAEEKYTEGEYFYKFNGHEINIVLRSIEKLRQTAKSPADPFQQEVFRDSVILFEGDGEVGQLIDATCNANV